MCIPGTQPDGYVLGRLSTSINTEKANITKQKCAYKWYNNGEHQIQLKCTDIIPDGYVRGRLPMTIECKEKLSKSHQGLKRSPETQNKINYTLKLNRKNNKFDSIQEKQIYEYLIRVYGDNDVEYHYFDKRYSNTNGVMWECDFYIKSKDLFIEYNGFPNHYIEPFNSNNIQHMQILEQCKNHPRNFIDSQMVDVWAKSDVEKVQCAKLNGLNYEVYYNINEIISE